MTEPRAVALIRSDDGSPVVGVEDMSRAGTTLFLSAYDRRSGAPGGLYSVPVTDVLNARLSRVLVKPLVIAAPNATPLRPHGIGAAALDDDSQLAVISRPDPRASHEPPEILLFRGDDRFRVLRRLTDRRLCNANEIIFLTPGACLITNDRALCGPAGRIFANLFQPGSGSVLRLDPTGLSTVAEGIRFANGIEADSGNVYVAATRGRALHIFDRGEIERAAAPVRPRRSLPLPGGPDNLVWGDDGKLYIALHPNLLHFALFRLARSVGAPTRIVRYDPSADRLEPVVDWAPRSVLPGATAALAYKGWLIVAGAFAEGLAVVRIEE